MNSTKNCTLRIAAMSDIHCEFHADRGKSFINSLSPDDLDVLILAGDISIVRDSMLLETLNRFCSKFKNQKIIFVHGNHEFYGSDRKTVTGMTREAEKKNPNLIWLDNEIATIRGQRFVGSPLWFPYHYENARWEKNIGDFAEIKNFKDWIYSENQKSINFLRSEIMSGDIVISHHLPTRKSTSLQYKNSPLNRFFVCDIENIIIKKMPALWVHGHTHSSLDYWIGDARVLCNPFGYARMEENAKFKERNTITLKQGPPAALYNN